MGADLRSQAVRRSRCKGLGAIACPRITNQPGTGKTTSISSYYNCTFKWRCAYLYAKQADSCEDLSVRIAKYGLDFQILKWSADELQPDQIGRKYESDADIIKKLEISMGEKTAPKKFKKKEWINTFFFIF